MLGKEKKKKKKRKKRKKRKKKKKKKKKEKKRKKRKKKKEKNRAACPNTGFSRLACAEGDPDLSMERRKKTNKK